MADTFGWIIRFVHVLAGVMWVGGIFLWGMVIAPSVARRVAPQARGPFMKEVLPRLTRYMTIAGIVTILSGFWVLGIIQGGLGNIDAGFQDSYRGYGPALATGVVAALAMMVIGLAVMQPSATKLLDMMAKAPAPAPGTPPGPPPAPVLALQKRLMIGGMSNLLLGTIALAAMAWAVNVYR